MKDIAYGEGVDDYCMTLAKALDIIGEKPAIPFVIKLCNRQTRLGVVRITQPESLWGEYTVIVRTTNRIPRIEMKTTHPRISDALLDVGGELWEKATAMGEGLLKVVGSGINIRGMVKTLVTLEQCAEVLGIANEDARNIYKNRMARVELLFSRVGRCRWKVSVLFPDAPIPSEQDGNYNRIDAVCSMPAQGIAGIMEMVWERVDAIMYR